MSIITNTCTLQRGEGRTPAINPMEARETATAPKTPETPWPLSNLLNAPRCQARNRAGGPCGRAAAKGKRVCVNHGARAGAPKGHRNGNYRHGAMTTEAIAERRQARALVREIRALADA